MPSYNTEKYIGDSIKSVLNQTYENWELIIVDDCSKDDTDSIVKQFKDSRIRYFKNAFNQGAAISRNSGLKKAKGKWIAFLDSDDLWLPDKLALQIKFMRDNQYSFSYTCYEKIDENSYNLGVFVSGPNKISSLGMYNFCWPGCLTVMYDLETVGLIQIQDIKKNNDYAMWLKIIKKTNCYLLNEPLSMYRVRKHSISHDNILKLIYSHFEVFRKSEKVNIVFASILTINNMFWGIIKKIFYVKYL
jgi:glycosyltransferase involved in cell wall biosynthesis